MTPKTLRLLLLALGMSWATAAMAQTTIYWKKDHIYANGKEAAIVTPAPTDVTAPGVPGSVTSSNLAATSVQISWAAATDTGGSGLAGYKVYRTTASLSAAAIPVGTTPAGTLSFTDRPLRPSTAYTYSVVAFDNAQNHSAFSAGVNVTTPSASGDVTAPGIPPNLTGYATASDKIRLNWQASADLGGSGISGYRVYRGGTLLTPTLVTAVTYEDTGLTKKTAYAYTVRAVDGNGTASADSNTANVTTDWEKVTDDFNRTSGFPGWTFTSSWVVASNTAQSSQAWGGSWIDASHSSRTTFRATVDVRYGGGLGGLNATGISFWDQNPYWAGGAKYRAYVSGGTLNLCYNTDTQICTTNLGSSNVGSATAFRLRVEADATTKVIKVYYNDLLKITFTETNGSRVASGHVGIASYPGYPNGGVAILDNFLLEY